ncbi:MAG: RNA polymerase sigma-70 factor [Prolixibacteraceae bacterium]
MSEMDRIFIEQVKGEKAEKTFEYLFHTYYSPLCSYACAMIKNQEDAKDLVNDCFLEFWRKRHDIEIKISVKSYLYVTVRNSAVNYIRKRQLDQKYSETMTYPFYLQEEINMETERLLQMENLEIRLKQAIDSLPQQCRYIFYMNRFEQQGYKDIALKMNLSTGTVKTQIARALKKLRSEFEGVIGKGQILFSIFVRHF